MNPAAYCRLCLKNDHWNSPISLFIDSYSLPVKIKDILGIDVNQNDSLPQVICHLCLAKITFFEDFHRQVRTSVSLLTSLVSSRDLQPQVKYINVESNVPNSTLSAQPLIPNQTLPLSTDNVPIAQIHNAGVGSLMEITTPSCEPAKSLRASSTDSSMVGSVEKDGVEPKKRNTGGRPGRPKRMTTCQNCQLVCSSFSDFKKHLNGRSTCDKCKSLFCTFEGLKFHHCVPKNNAQLPEATGTSARRKIVDKNTKNDKIVNETDGKQDCQENDENRNDILVCKRCDRIYLTSEGLKLHRCLSENSSPLLEVTTTNGKKNTENENENTVNQTDGKQDCQENDKNRNDFLWCKSCDKIFLTSDEFKEHNDEIHSLSSGNENINKSASTKALKDKTVLTNDEFKPQSKAIYSSGRKRGRKRINRSTLSVTSTDEEFDDGRNKAIHSSDGKRGHENVNESASTDRTFLTNDEFKAQSKAMNSSVGKRGQGNSNRTSCTTITVNSECDSSSTYVIDSDDGDNNKNRHLEQNSNCQRQSKNNKSKISHNQSSTSKTPKKRKKIDEDASNNPFRCWICETDYENKLQLFKHFCEPKRKDGQTEKPTSDENSVTPLQNESVECDKSKSCEKNTKVMVGEDDNGTGIIVDNENGTDVMLLVNDMDNIEGIYEVVTEPECVGYKVEQTDYNTVAVFIPEVADDDPLNDSSKNDILDCGDYQLKQEEEGEEEYLVSVSDDDVSTKCGPEMCDEDVSTKSGPKMCDECGETLGSLEALVEHKRSHETTSDNITFSVNRILN